MDGIEKLLKTSFAGAANQLTQLYVTSLQQQKQSYIAGYSSAIESVIDFVHSSNSQVIMVDSLLEFLRKEMNKPHSPINNSTSTSSTSSTSAATPSTIITPSTATNSPSNNNNNNNNNINFSSPSNYNNTHHINNNNPAFHTINNNNNNNNNTTTINNRMNTRQDNTDTSIPLTTPSSNFGFTFQPPSSSSLSIHSPTPSSHTLTSPLSKSTIPPFNRNQTAFSFSPSQPELFSRSSIGNNNAFNLSFEQYTQQQQQQNQLQTQQPLQQENVTPTKKRANQEFTPPSTPPIELWDQLLKKVRIDL